MSTSFLSSFIKIHRAVLEKKSKMWSLQTTTTTMDDGRCAMTIAQSSLRLRWAKKKWISKIYEFDKLIGWLYWGFTSLQRYFSHILTWKQEITNLKIQVSRPGIEPRSSCSASQEMNHSATAAPNLISVVLAILLSVWLSKFLTIKFRQSKIL